MRTPSNSSPYGSGMKTIAFGLICIMLFVNVMYFSWENVTKSFSKIIAVQEKNATLTPQCICEKENGNTMCAFDGVDNLIRRMLIKSPKIILRWTTRLNMEWNTPEIESSHTSFTACKYSNCALTNDKSLVDQAHMILFYHRDDPNFPEIRHPWHLYTHLTADPPRELNDTLLDVYRGKLNLSANFRLDSDIPKPQAILETIANPTDNLYVPTLSLGERNHFAFWIVSHCIVPSKRDIYVQELQKYVKVDIFGRCGKNICPKTDNSFASCYKKIGGDYKFYLAFENRFCKDYYSEKAVQPFPLDVIPVVLGLAKYSRDFPPHSVIDVRDFNSPKHLAEYLTYLADNETAYNEYFQWKTRFRMAPSKHLCKMCEILNTPPYIQGKPIVPTFGKDFRLWWQTPCENDMMDIMKDAGGW